VQELLVVSTHIETNWQHAVRCDASCCAVERELANRDAHAVGSKVAEAKDS
jgi:hypothetical protein